MKDQDCSSQAGDRRQAVGGCSCRSGKAGDGCCTVPDPELDGKRHLPASAQQSQAGTGGHTGTGSDGHPSTAGQQAATPATTATGTAPDASSTNVFSVPSDNSGSAARAEQSGKLPEGLVRTAVTMQEAVDAVKATFTAANQACVSSARISLSPESLGGIRISLSQTPEGLIARVTADHPEAAQTLQQNAGDLKRSLEQSGMSLLRLDIGSSGAREPRQLHRVRA